jgi:signal transduction histidine kinase
MTQRFVAFIIVYGLAAALAFGTLFCLQEFGVTSVELLASPATLVALNLCLLFVVAPLRDQVRISLARAYRRDAYDSERELVRLGQALAAAQTIDEVITHATDTLVRTVNPERHLVTLRNAQGALVRHGAARQPPPKPLILSGALVTHLEAGQILTRRDWEDDELTAPLLDQVRTELLVPAQGAGGLVAVLFLGRRGYGGPYTPEDLRFLHAVASTLALALGHTAAMARLQALNAGLEHQVAERTAALQTANAELNSSNDELSHSFDDLRRAYEQLEQNHHSLLRAERLATLGRLTAGMAHEVNTPLSAVHNALKIIGDLGREYADSIDDEAVLPNDHRDIAAEIVRTATAATDWVQKAALFIRATKSHGRAPTAAATRFNAQEVVDEVNHLLGHRLRAASCSFAIDTEPNANAVVLLGDRSAFAQVIVNLVTNALDAYEESTITNRRVVVALKQVGESGTIEVRDWAGGIPLHVLPHIFDEMFTTKAVGRGTGLGLWLARSIIEKDFGGTLDVMTTAGEGSRFSIVIPVHAPTAEVQAA